MEIQNNPNPIISLACSSLCGEDDEDTSGVIIENLTMQPNILLIFKSDYSFLRLTSYISVYYCRLDIAITAWKIHHFLCERKSPGCQLFSAWSTLDVRMSCRILIDKRQPSYNQFPVNYLEMRWQEQELELDVDVETEDRSVEKLSWKQSPVSRPLQSLVHSADSQTWDLPLKLPDTCHEIPIN